VVVVAQAVQVVWVQVVLLVTVVPVKTIHQLLQQPMVTVVGLHLVVAVVVLEQVEQQVPLHKVVVQVEFKQLLQSPLVNLIQVEAVEVEDIVEDQVRK
tara:strand:+ start:188 stop:481 length:294 start_codon:yes stop_codon:yes gene_type:complete